MRRPDVEVRNDLRGARRRGLVEWLALGGLAIKVYLLLILTRVIISVAPLRSITSRLGHFDRENESDDLSPQERRFAYRVGSMVRRLAPYTPTNSNCYPQALTAWWLLTRRGIPSTYYYGARFQPGGVGLDTHVWLRSGNVIVTGGLVGPYKPLTRYAADRAFVDRNAGRRFRRSTGLIS